MSSAIPMHPWHSSRIWSIYFLEDVLGADKAKGKKQEKVSSKGTVECCEKAGVLIKNGQPVSMVGIQLGEVARVHELMGDFLHSGHLVVIMANGLVEIRGI